LELEEACLQYKTKHQLLNALSPTSMRKHAAPVSELEAFLKSN